MTRWEPTPEFARGMSGGAALCRITSNGASAPEHPDFMISLTVPGTLLYRPLVLRVVESSCKLVRVRSCGALACSRAHFDDEVVSAFSEAFNNVAIHGYAGRAGDVYIEIQPDDGGITIRMLDTGKSFDPDQVEAPRLEELPESGMGLFIIHSFMDRVAYSRGDPPRTPNVLVLYKRLRGDGVSKPASPEENPK